MKRKEKWAGMKDSKIERKEERRKNKEARKSKESKKRLNGQIPEDRCALC